MHAKRRALLACLCVCVKWQTIKFYDILTVSSRTHVFGSGCPCVALAQRTTGRICCAVLCRRYLPNIFTRACLLISPFQRINNHYNNCNRRVKPREQQVVGLWFRAHAHAPRYAIETDYVSTTAGCTHNIVFMNNLAEIWL